MLSIEKSRNDKVFLINKQNKNYVSKHTLYIARKVQKIEGLS
jgi:hypothetical protein